MKKLLLTFFALSVSVLFSWGQLVEISDLAELKNHEGEEVILLNAKIHAVDEGMYKDYFLQDGETFVADFIYGGEFDLRGVYSESVFTVYDVVLVHGFNTISELDNYVSNYKPEAAGMTARIYNSMIVTHVERGCAFVQYEGVNEYSVSMVRSSMLTGIDANVKMGDKITGVKGVSYPCDYYQDEKSNYHVNRGCYFELSDDVELSILSSNNEIDYGSGSVDLPSLFFSQFRYNSNALSLAPGGTIISDKGRYYYEISQKESVENPMTGKYEERLVTYSLELVPNGVDLSSYVDKEVNDIMVGVYNYKNISENDECFYVDGIQSSNRGFENLAELIARGSSNDKMAVLENPVVVSYIFLPDWRNTVALIVQDESAGIFMQFDKLEAIEGINVGDSITSIRGVASWGIYASPCIQIGSGSPIEVVSSGNEVSAWEVSLSQLSEEYRVCTTTYKAPTEWVNRLVQLYNVQYSTGVDEYGDERPCLVDGEDVLWLEKDFGTKYGMEVGQYYDVCGIVDYCRLNRDYLYTIVPRAITDVWPAGVKGVELDRVAIYVDESGRVVAGDAVSMAVYDMNGRVVAEANGSVVDAVSLVQGVYIVQARYVDGVVKAAKIIR